MGKSKKIAREKSMIVISGLFRKPATAKEALKTLNEEGFARKDINLVSSDTDDPYALTLQSAKGSFEYDEGAFISTIGGGILGGCIGLLLGLLLLPAPTIPAGSGILSEQIISVVAGFFMGAGIGTLLGSVLGAFFGNSIDGSTSDEHTRQRRGGAVLMVMSNAVNPNHQTARRLLRRAGAIDITVEDWQPFKPTSEQLDPQGYTEQWKETSKAGSITGAASGAVVGSLAGLLISPLGVLIIGVFGTIVGAFIGAAGDLYGKRLRTHAQ